MNSCIKRIELTNGLIISIYDTTRRYYEDYHLVRLEMVCEAPLRKEYFDGPAEFSEALGVLGEYAVYRKTIEKMGVPYDEIGQAREQLVQGIENNCRGYFARASFPRKLVKTELAKARDKRRRSPC
jgi:hypothetical protein